MSKKKDNGDKTRYVIDDTSITNIQKILKAIQEGVKSLPKPDKPKK